MVWWYALTVVLAGHLVLDWEALAETWRARRRLAFAMALGHGLVGCVAALFLLAAAFGMREPALIATVVVLGLSAGALVLLRIARFHGKPIRETLREGLRASWRQSRRAWLVNAVLTVAILVGEIVAVPHYEYLFKDFGGQLPTPTQAVIDDCNFLQSYLLLVPFMLAGLHFLYVWWEGLTRAGARVGGDIRLFRWLVWIGFGLYPVLIMVALYLPIWSLRGALR